MKAVNRVKSVLAAAAAAMTILSATAGDSKSNDGLVVDISADRAECLYKLGEEATFTVTAKTADGRPATSGKLKWTLNNFGGKVFASEVVDLGKNGSNVFTVKGAQTEPDVVGTHPAKCHTV